MKNVVLTTVIIVLCLVGCSTPQEVAMDTGAERTQNFEEEPIRIANDSLEYEIIITDLGFPRFLNTQPPQEYYGIGFLEGKNNFFVAEYNRRVLNNRFSRELYPQQIDYNPNVHYGKEVNYLLYQYFRYFSRTYNQKFPGLRN
ncbi:DUF6146 family protein [Marinirhabdus gelatinilytica]|uniref:Lipoprotein n=1 Tax=Marinirhabdus gelatinilytica TaxID=1703343 RepID=A0A370QAI3_9FLAO|nr:DUF6146 family protein [Marinirhabdus gelatinilytica]RDK85388.1 hypothetical protein C8D94_103213 [Marinirhabdus gelatinilytica]